MAGAATSIPEANYYSTNYIAIAQNILTDAVAVSAGSFHGLALKADRTIVGWGITRSPKR